MTVIASCYDKAQEAHFFIAGVEPDATIEGLAIYNYAARLSLSSLRSANRVAASAAASSTW
jgi:hypothetical protein